MIGREEIDSVVEVLKSGFLTCKSGDGPYVRKFEDAFARYIGVRYAISMNSGTAALHAALMAAEVGNGDEVIVPSFTFAATSEAVVLTGAKPVFVDIDPQTYCMDPACFEEAINSRTRAVIPVHLYGLMADMERIVKIAKEHEITVIEDAAQAHGAEFKGKKAGSYGDFGCFSFYASKTITTGEGGMVTTNKRENADLLMSIRNHGEGKQYSSERLGHNYRLPEISAAIGYRQLLKLPRFLDLRRKNAAKLTSILETVGRLSLPIEPENYKHAWYVYTVRLRGSRAGERNKVVDKLVNAGIQAGIYYSTPLHLTPFYRMKYGYHAGMLPKTESTARQVFSLPVHPALTDEDTKFIGEKLKKILR
jgi:dTDP-4-amino-4,6-dideoxygalactose transaminase